MDFLKKKNLYFILTALLTTSACQMGYLIKNGWNQMSLLSQRQPLSEAIQSSKVSDDEKRKLQLAIEVREFAATELGLKVDQIYTSFVKLDHPYVTWVVSGSPKWKLESYLWSFPIVGKMPYKGYFNEPDALEEQKKLSELDLDTYVRGVSAYSTLGWFKDPLLSSMMNGPDHELVETMIHELVHATLYIKHQADFNERFAVFLGDQGMQKFYLKKEGLDSKNLKIARDEKYDSQLFSRFITIEIENLNSWYSQTKESDRIEDQRQKKFLDIKNKFKNDILPKMKTQNWSRFTDIKLNNARLSVYKTYMSNLDDFERLYIKSGSDFKTMLETCKKLENHPDPEQGLKNLL